MPILSHCVNEAYAQRQSVNRTASTFELRQLVLQPLIPPLDDNGPHLRCHFCPALADGSGFSQVPAHADVHEERQEHGTVQVGGLRVLVLLLLHHGLRVRLLLHHGLHVRGREAAHAIDFTESVSSVCDHLVLALLPPVLSSFPVTNI